MKNKLLHLQEKIIKCKKCPRLTKYINEIKEKYPSYWCHPVPSFGNANAEILIVGLAPGRFGSNRTGRMFTGDSSGNFMYKILYDVGLCTKPISTSLNDGLKLKNTYITAVGRCAPPQNKPTKKELENCFPFFIEELKLLKNIKVIVALGKIAFDSYINWLFKYGRSASLSEPRAFGAGMQNKEYKLNKKDFKFFHGAVYNYDFMPHILIASYHPSRQNTQTGRLTKEMFKSVFQKAISLV